MSVTIKAAGGVWRAELAEEGGERVVVFFCTSSDQRPWRVVRVERDRFEDGGFDEIAAADLAALFEASRSMGIPEEYPTYPS